MKRLIVQMMMAVIIAAVGVIPPVQAQSNPTQKEIYDGKFAHDPGKGVKKPSYYTYKKMAEILEGGDWNNIKTIKEEQNHAYGLFQTRSLEDCNLGREHRRFIASIGAGMIPAPIFD